MRPLEQVTKLLERLLSAVLFGMFLMIAILVVLRYAFGTTIIGGNESTVIAFVYATAIGAALALGRDDHIAIRFFVDKLSPQLQAQLQRLRVALLVTLNLAVLIFAIEWIRRTGHFMMPTLGVPQWVAQFSIPAGAALSVLYCGSRWGR